MSARNCPDPTARASDVLTRLLSRAEPFWLSHDDFTASRPRILDVEFADEPVDYDRQSVPVRSGAALLVRARSKRPPATRSMP